jgi:hypothetical protein
VTRLSLACAVLIVAACRGGASQAPAFDGEQALRWVEHMVAAGARVPNTAAHGAIGRWLVDELRARAESVEVHDWVHVTQTGDSLRMRNILARFRPADPNRVLYVSHWDSRPHADQDPDPARRHLPVPGANDGASSTAMLLGVADELRRRPPAVGVDLLFVDGEDWGDDFSGPDALIGSRYFAANLPAGYRPLFAVVWDMVGGRSQRFLRESHSLERAPEVVERVWTAAEAIGLGRVFLDRDGGPVTDDHVPLLEAGLRAIDVLDCCDENYPYWHTVQDTPDKLSPRSLANVGRLALYLVR